MQLLVHSLHLRECVTISEDRKEVCDGKAVPSHRVVLPQREGNAGCMEEEIVQEYEEGKEI